MSTTLCVPDAADNVEPVLINPAPSPKNVAAVIDPKPTISGVPVPTISPPI